MIEICSGTSHREALRPMFPDRLEFRSVSFCGRRENRECRKPLRARQKPTTNSTHLWHHIQDLNLGHIGGRWGLSPLHHPYSPHAHHTMLCVFTALPGRKPLLWRDEFLCFWEEDFLGHVLGAVVQIVDNAIYWVVIYLRPISQKPWKLFGPAKPLLVHLYLKMENCIGLKLLVWRRPLFILRIHELNSCVIISFEILLWLSGCENFSGPSRNGPLGLVVQSPGELN